MYYKHCLKYCSCEFEKKSAFFSDWEIIYFYTVIIQVPIFCLPLSRQQLFLLSTKKLNAQASPFFFFFFGFPAQCTYSTKLGKFDQKMGNLVTRCFPPLNFGLMGPVFDLIHWELFFLIGPQYAGCLHTAAFSGRVLGAFPNLSQGIQCYLLTTFSPVNLFSFFFSPSV